LIAPRPGQRWLLVTSSIHMPRAVGTYSQAKFIIEAWPIEDIDERSPRAVFSAVHEWLGLVAYWAQGKSNAIFPAPRTEISGGAEPAEQVPSPVKCRSKIDIEAVLASR